MDFRNSNFVSFILVLGLALTSPLVYANLSDDAIGTYAGNINIVETACTPPTANGSETASVALTISKISTNNFQGSGIISFNDGETDDLSLSIAGITPSTFSFSWTENGIDNSFQASGTGSGSLTSSGITISGTGTEIGGFTCTINFSGTLTKTDNVIATEIAPSSTVTDSILFNTLIQGTVLGIGTHISSSLHGVGPSGGPRVTGNQFKIEGGTGLNAGDGSSIPYGVWGNYSYTDYENDLSSTAFDGSSHSFLGGIDFGFWDNTIIGIAVGYDKGDIDTTFNGGNQDTDTFTIAPYFGALLDDVLSVDFTVGYSNVDYEQFRTLPGTTTRVTSTPDADRWFSALNLNAVTFYDKWILGGRIGALYASSVIDSFTESNGTFVAESRTKVGTFSIAGDVAYSYNNYEPFLNLAYNYDFSLRKIAVISGPQPSNDDDDILMTAGVRYFNKNGISGNLEYSKRFFRDDFDEDRISLTLRADF